MPTPAGSETGELAEAVGRVFETMLGLQAGIGGEDLPACPDLMTAAVYLSGKHRGAVLIHCLPPQACAFAGRFLSSAPPHSVDDEVFDILGELTNMVAGNLPCALLPGTVLSVPSVFEGPATKLRVCGSHGADRTAFRTPSGPFWVTMVATGGSTRKA
jgi:CheY-specific phosphatase CheX